MKIKFSIFIILYTLWTSTMFAQLPKGSDKFSGKLSERLATMENEWISIHIVLNDQMDFEAWNKNQNTLRSDFETRTTLLIRELRQKSKTTQDTLLAFLASHPDVNQSSIKSYYIANVISCEVRKLLIPDIVSRNDVKWIGENTVLIPGNVSETQSQTLVSENGSEKGLIAIGAPAMWALGYTGYNRLVFTADTGVDPNHPALKAQYNGNFYSEKESWYSYFKDTKPYDCDRHGTHVTGTILGIDRLKNDTIGVAFNARWIGADILCGIGTADNIGAFEWALDPDGNPETTHDIPDVINNSWYDPSLDGLDCYSVYVPILEALEAAGVAVVFSAGNSGPDPLTITPPHNININEVNAFTVGAINGNAASFPIASFSSNGPSYCPGEGPIKIKPEVSAPGVLVRSCVPKGEYALLSGTSMAAPHVSGAILLLKEAFPYLGGKDLKLALYHTCVDLGESGEDNKFGMGLINVYQAYLYLINKGYQPVPGKARKDLVLLDIYHEYNSCSNKLKPIILIENAGTDTITSILIKFEGQDFTKSYIWTGALVAGERKYIYPVIEGVPESKSKIKVTLESLNGEQDERNYNNQAYITVNITDSPEPSSEIAFENHFCTNSDIFLEYESQAGHKNIKLSWYDQPFGGNLIFEGNTIKLENLNQDKVIYAEPYYADQTGITDIQKATGIYKNQPGEGLIFDVNAIVSLDTLVVYSKEVGVRNFYLIDSNGDSITSSKKYINKIGANIVKLNWVIPPGRDYRIVMKEGKSLYASTDNVKFPYADKNNVLSIKRGTDGEQYNYFYQWKISYPEPCGRVEYDIKVRPDTIIGKADFELSADSLDISEQALIHVTDKSENALHYFWNMGDGSKYNDKTVSHQYNTSGNYSVRLQILDNNDCLSTTSKSVIITDLKISSSEDVKHQDHSFGFFIYPNPVSDNINIGFYPIEQTNITLKLLDFAGKTIQKFSLAGSHASFSLSIEFLPPGLYVIWINNGKNTFTQRILKQ